ncbi:hypothetical protein R5W23_006215 [Gemmata sp. JC673]|uniref:Right handed beta helix domain-containing protein n=1 Tax=Gemmata algarum TaxID=2975278 RepID=A0ABU5EV31_9BACT|nr:hypothetical protein [Gemmata algarum]MDY3559025.1 hypothetical protein [Gemmata algarum]
MNFRDEEKTKNATPSLHPPNGAVNLTVAIGNNLQITRASSKRVLPIAALLANRRAAMFSLLSRIAGRIGSRSIQARFANRSPLQLLELESRDTPSVYYVTNGNDSGPGSLRAAYEAAIINGNSAELLIDDGVSVITLDSPLVNASAINLTDLTISAEDSDNVYVNASIAHQYRFIDHVGNNGITITLNDISVVGFGSLSGDGGAIKTVAPLHINSCIFEGNSAAGGGGAIFAEYILEANDSEFYYNYAYGDGGAICSVPQNTAASLTVRDCYFEENNSDGNGAAIYFNTVAGVFGLYSSEFVHNVTDALGVVYQYGGTFEGIGGSIIHHNHAWGGIGVLYLTEVYAAHVDMLVSSVNLTSSIPPAVHSYWADINELAAGYIVSNWPY